MKKDTKTITSASSVVWVSREFDTLFWVRYFDFFDSSCPFAIFEPIFDTSCPFAIFEPIFDMAPTYAVTGLFVKTMSQLIVIIW